MLAAFGAAYNVHARVQARAFAQEGVVAVGLANAVRCALPISASSGRRSHLQGSPAQCTHSQVCKDCAIPALRGAAADRVGWGSWRL